jgi:hypothetical protein
METIVVLVPVDANNSRKICENMENEKFDSINDIWKYLEDKTAVHWSNVLVYRMTDFMEAVNDQDMDTLTEYFMSYVQVKTAKNNS